MLELEHVTRTFTSRTAVRDFSFNFENGKTYALLGPNGSGKTTLMKMIAGLIRPTSGDIRFEGLSIGPATKARIAYMPTENYFFDYMTIADAGKYYNDFYSDFSRHEFDQALARMELSPKDKIRQLSSGMSAKVRLALTLSRDAELMMFDEPLNGVDILTRAQVVSEIVNRRNAGRTMIISTHLVDDLEKHLDYALFMRSGDLVLSGSCDDLRQKGTLTEQYLSVYGFQGTEGGAAHV